MARSGVVVIRNKDQHIPEKLKDSLVDSCRAIGCAFVDGSKIESFSENAKPSAKSIMESENAFNFRQVLWFGCSEADFLEDDLQPFSLVEDIKGNKLIVAMLEGDFTPYDHPEDNHSTAYFVVNETLAEKVNKVYEDCDEDLKKTMQILQSKDFRDELKPVIHTNGWITLLCSNGEMVSYHPKDYNLHVTGAWGMASKSMGYEEPKHGTAAPPADTGIVENAAQKLARLRAEKAGKAPGTGPQPSVPPVAQKGKTDTAIPPTAGKPKDNDDPIQLPPKEYLAHRKKDTLINKWWNRNFEYGTDKSKRPAGWDSGLIGFPYSKLSTNSNLRAHRPGETIRAPVPDIPPIISAKHIEIMNAERGFLKDVNEDSPNLLNLKSINELEENYSSFFEQCDYPIHMFLRWSLKKKRDFVKEYPQAAYTALVDLCTMVTRMNPKLLEAPPKKEEEKKETAATAPTVTESAAERLARIRAEKAAKAA